MERDREQIIKAYEHCSTKIICKGCPYVNSSRENDCTIHKDVLMLIKELTEELQEERTWAYSMIDNLRDDIRELAEENKKLIVERDLHRVSVADTIREMQEKLKEYLDDFYNSSEDALLDVPDLIDQIAKEMLEEKNDD